MTKIDDGGPAYPLAVPVEFQYAENGLTKREAFAMAAMQGMLAGNATYNGKSDDRGALARDAVAHADALLAALRGDANG